LGDNKFGESIMKKLIALASLLGCGVAQAIPVTFTIENAIFEDGGRLLGSFTFDDETFEYSDISITTTGGATFDGGIYNYLAKDVNHSAWEHWGIFVQSEMADLTNMPMLVFVTQRGLVAPE
jgi:hypothetical protein